VPPAPPPWARPRRASGSGGARILVCGLFRPPAKPSQLTDPKLFDPAAPGRHPPTDKRPDVLVTASLCGFQTVLRPSAHIRAEDGRGYSPPSMVSRGAEYTVPMRSWIELGS